MDNVCASLNKITEDKRHNGCSGKEIPSKDPDQKKMQQINYTRMHYLIIAKLF